MGKTIDNDYEQGKIHFYKVGCCVIKYERQGQGTDWILEEIYGPFINYVEAERWQQMPENYIGNNPKLRYTIQYLTDPGL